MVKTAETVMGKVRLVSVVECYHSFTSILCGLYKIRLGDSKMKKRKYPISLFLIGIAMNLVSFFPLLLIAIILFVIRIFISGLPTIIPLSFVMLWILASVLRQLIYRNVALKSEHPAFEVFEHDNPYQAIRESVDNAIAFQNNDTTNNKNEQS